MRSLLVLLVVAVFVTVGCNDTHSARCNDVLLSQNTFLDKHGWRLECGAGGGVKPDGTFARGWTDFATNTVYLWPDQMPDDRVLRKVAQHELGHVLYGHDETTAELFSYCTLKQDGIGYALSPYPPLPSSCGQFDGWQELV